MKTTRSSSRRAGGRLLQGVWVGLALALAAAGGLAGCGTPGAPLPPSLKLPDPVTNLAAVRTGDVVTLTWSMAKKNTDKLLIKGNVPVRICRKQGDGSCDAVAANLWFAPGAKGEFTESLPQALASGSPRALTYYVELLSPHGRSAGLSNPAWVVAGQAPAAVTGLTVGLRKQGAVLRWNEQSPETENTILRLHRTLLGAPARAQSGEDSRRGLLTADTEPVEQSLLVESPRAGQVLDETIRFGNTYEYRAQRVARVEIGGEKVELAGPLSMPVRVEAIDTFPPAVPSGLAAVATAGEAGSAPSIDLSWIPVAEADVAGYAVYRRQGDGEWRRISPLQPVAGPAFHDADVKAGQTYLYAVTAIDQGGHESARSAEAAETVPNN